MKIIFLDIDGVLNSSRTYNPKHFPYIVEPKPVDRLIETLRQSGAEVVLASTWRFDPIGRLAAKESGIPFIDCLPELPGQSRSAEIRAWLDRHLEVTRYVAVDDEDDGLDDVPLFQPDPNEGLSPEIAIGVCDYLAGNRKSDMRRSLTVRLYQNAKAALQGHKG